MPSFDVVNYSLRANKCIQRSLVFEGVRRLADLISFDKVVYVGLGSIWFTDFHVAHKQLRINEMISIEADPIGFKRACFNRPFKKVRIEQGYSYDVIPELLKDEKLNKRPWFLWLDYDSGLDEDKVAEIRSTIERLPSDSIFLISIPVQARRFGRPNQRGGRIKELLGDIVPDDIPKDALDDDTMPQTILDLVSDLMASAAARSARLGGFVRGFKISYRDGTPMITVGGLLPSIMNEAAALKLVESSDWPALISGTIEAPPLTFKEASVFQSELPMSRPITRTAIQRLGFDLEEAQLKSFEKFYRHYPIFSQILA